MIGLYNKSKNILGLTLIEALVSVVIVGIGFVSIFQMVNYSIRSIDVSGERTKTNFLVSMVAEDLLVQGGPNAGHTLEFDGIKHVLHTIPSGIFHPGVINLIGNGVVIDPVIFEKEIIDIKALKIPMSELLISGQLRWCQ